MKLLLLGAVAVGALLQGAAAARAQARAPLPPVPFEDSGACPFEGCTYREWTARQAVSARTDRRASAPLAFKVAAGEKVVAVTGVVVTLKPGHVQFRERTTLRSMSGDVEIAPGETLYLLTYQGEGFTKAWFKGRLLTDVDTTQFPRNAVVGQAKTEWWVQIRNGAGKRGWTGEPEKFDGKDALGLSAWRLLSAKLVRFAEALGPPGVYAR